MPRSRGLLVAACALAGLVLTGCLSMELDTTVSADARFTGAMQVQFQKRVLQGFGVTSLDELQGQLGEQSENARARISWSETEQEYVQTVSFTDATAQEINDAVSGQPAASSSGSANPMQVDQSLTFPLSAEIRGESMVVTLTQGRNASSPSPSDIDLDDPQVRALLEAFFTDSDFALSITMPGDISGVTGTWPAGAKGDPAIVVNQPDPTTYEISAPLLKIVDLAAAGSGSQALEITSAITAKPVQAPATQSDPTTGGPPLAALLGGAGAVVALLVVVGVVLVRRRAGPSLPGEDGPGHGAVPASGPPPAPGPGAGQHGAFPPPADHGPDQPRGDDGPSAAG